MLKSVKFNHTNLLAKPSELKYDYFEISVGDSKRVISDNLLDYLTKAEKDIPDDTVIFYIFLEESKYNREGYWMVSARCEYASSLQIFKVKKWRLEVSHAIETFLNEFFDLYIIVSRMSTEDLLEDFGITPESLAREEVVQEMSLSTKGMVEIKTRHTVEGEEVDDSQEGQSRTFKLRTSVQQRKGTDNRD